MNILANFTNLRQVILIYECKDLFLYEIIEDYKSAESTEEQNEIFHAFCSMIWSSPLKRRTCTKTIRFHVKSSLQHTQLGKVFQAWSEVEYKSYQTMTEIENWCSLLRQKINNIYTRYFDKEVILDQEYIDLLKTPKRLYYEWTLGADMDAAAVTELIADAVDQSEKLKAKLQMQKMCLSFYDYKILMEGFLRKGFDRCRLLEEYEDQSSIITHLDFLNEDHFYVGYLCKRLEGNIKDYRKQYYGLKFNSRKGYKRCEHCGVLIEKTGNRRTYCDKCAKLKKKESNQKANLKYNLKRRENRKVRFSL